MWEVLDCNFFVVLRSFRIEATELSCYWLLVSLYVYSCVCVSVYIHASIYLHSGQVEFNFSGLVVLIAGLYYCTLISCTLVSINIWCSSGIDCTSRYSAFEVWICIIRNSWSTWYHIKWMEESGFWFIYQCKFGVGLSRNWSCK